MLDLPTRQAYLQLSSSVKSFHHTSLWAIECVLHYMYFAMPCTNKGILPELLENEGFEVLNPLHLKTGRNVTTSIVSGGT